MKEEKNHKKSEIKKGLIASFLNRNIYLITIGILIIGIASYVLIRR